MGIRIHEEKDGARHILLRMVQGTSYCYLPHRRRHHQPCDFVPSHLSVLELGCKVCPDQRRRSCKDLCGAAVCGRQIYLRGQPKARQILKMNHPGKADVGKRVLVDKKGEVRIL